jgi:hypothetical protein
MNYAKPWRMSGKTLQPGWTTARGDFSLGYCTFSQGVVKSSLGKAMKTSIALETQNPPSALAGVGGLLNRLWIWTGVLFNDNNITLY